MCRTVVWALFVVAIVVLLLVDLARRGSTAKGIPSMRSSFAWSVGWTVVALAFTVVLLVWQGGSRPRSTWPAS